MSNAWILVADAARARIFSTEGAGEVLESVEQYVSPRARLHDRDLESDRPGRGYNDAGGGSHAMGPEDRSKEHDAVRFAGEVAGQLERGRVEHRFGRLIVVAEPQFLGLLRKSIKPALAGIVAAEIGKDLSKAGRDEIQQHLPAQF